MTEAKYVVAKQEWAPEVRRELLHWGVWQRRPNGRRSHKNTSQIQHFGVCSRYLQVLFRERHGPVQLHGSHCWVLVLGALRPLLPTLLYPAAPSAPLPEAVTGQTLNTKADLTHSSCPSFVRHYGIPKFALCYQRHTTQRSRPLFTVRWVMTDIITSIFFKQILIAYISTLTWVKRQFQAAFWQILSTWQFWS